MALDIESLLQPIGEDSPSGENLEYDAAFQELDRLAQGKPGVYDPVSGETSGAEEPDWRQVRDLALELSGRTHDVRVAFILTLALMRLEGMAGLATGLNLIGGMVSQFWPNFFPNLIEDEDNDPIERLNALAMLVDPERFMPFFRSTPIVEAPGIGRFNMRDLDIAQGRLDAREGETAASPALLAGAWQDGDADENATRAAAVDAAIEALNDIESTFSNEAGTSPDFGDLVRQLKQLRNFYAELSGGGAGADAAAGDEAAGAAGAPAAGGGQSVGGLASRADAVRVLRQVSDFLKRAEPSSPAPMLLDRAVKLLEMDFVDIVRELMPESRERIELIGGIRFEENED
ncbi:type VI secretion system protein TssA [Parasulfuritortus cantonensis]|uniref:Type VI secretion system protein TssA n=1 Tax=Parasulfuritortus cantonensis TaxID=2528202 RepID=A0A4R1BRM6_9PROT|nr:type VI secretion system protein TssA [Parasulfuritortus cantonensis]TCJ20394.1 type VI secretion system protein TssA [Parasulfuritortus cantonensis]